MTEPAPPLPPAVLPPVLIVDDDSQAAFSVECMLELLGLPAHLAANGREAVAMAKAARYDLILMDIEMPEMDGMEAAKQIRRDELVAQRPAAIIVAMTGHNDRGVAVLCRMAGMNDVLVKPFLVAALRDKLAAACPALPLDAI